MIYYGINVNLDPWTELYRTCTIKDVVYVTSILLEWAALLLIQKLFALAGK